MGEVYRAQDTTLKREVAIKVLPEQFTQDTERLARFQREAQVLASLNHPNISAIHSLEHSDGVLRAAPLERGARQKSDDWIMPRLYDWPSIPKNPQSVH